MGLRPLDTDSLGAAHADLPSATNVPGAGVAPQAREQPEPAGVDLLGWADKDFCVIGVLGPTGVGKTAVAIELARLLGVRVISCDSMQIYQGFPVLTNQPTCEERKAAPHELVDFADPRRPFSAALYAETARPLIEQDLERCGRALLVGGTGLYMRAALAPLAVQRQGDPALRRELEGLAAACGPEAVYARLLAVDPVAARSIDPRNVRRVIRALEAICSSGQRWSGRTDLWEPNYYHPSLIVGLTTERSTLHARINRRAAYIVRNGAVEEVRRFREAFGEEQTSPGGPGIRSAIGYRETWRYLAGEQDLAVTIEQLATATRQYARRQLTWLRKVRGAVIIDVRGRQAREIAAEIASLAEQPSLRLGGTRNQ